MIEKYLALFSLVISNHSTSDMKAPLLLIWAVMLSFTGLTQLQCDPPTSISVHDVNQHRVRLCGGGHPLGDPGGAPGLTASIANGPYRSLIYSMGFWAGGISPDQQLKLAAVTYPMGLDYFPGQIPNDQAVNILPDCGAFFDRHYTMHREVAERHRAYSLCVSDPNCDLEIQFPLGYEIHPTLFEYPGANPDFDVEGAPFVDVDGDGYYDPAAGDYPLFISMPEAEGECCAVLKGDYAVFWYTNDLAGIHSSSQGEPIGIDLEQLIYGYYSEHGDAPLFHRIKMTNRFLQTLTNLRMGLFMDPDIGINPANEYFGSDPSRSLVFFYNEGGDASGAPETSDWDGLNPVLGYAMLKGGQSMVGQPMDVALFYDPYATTSLPITPVQHYNWMKGVYFNGLPIEENGVQFPFQQVGYPDGAENFQAGDQRVLVATDGGTNSPGDVECLEGAFLFHPNLELEAPYLATHRLADLYDEVHETWSTCFECVTPVVRIVAEPIGDGFAFYNLSAGDSYLWDFGDGETSEQRFPQHSYSSNEVFTVTLAITNACGSASGTVIVDPTVHVSETTAVHQCKPDVIEVYPNPASGHFTVATNALEANQHLRLYNPTGQVVEEWRHESVSQVVACGGLPAGVYLLTLEGTSGVINKIRVSIQ